jgi:ATP synthase F1 delta subunit
LKQSSCKCDKCSDTGWINKESQWAQPSVASCECRVLERIKNQWKAAGINPEKSNQTFGSFEVWNEPSRKAKDTAITYYKAFQSIKGSRKNSIMFCGQVGSGKTHISIALAQNFLNKSIKVAYMPYRDIITKLKQNMLDEDYYQSILSKYQLCEILLIDDLFKGKIDEELLAFMIILIEKNRILQLRGKLDQMINIDLERKNTIRGMVKTAIPLLPEELEKLKDIFEKKYDKTILFNTEIDKSILGGVYVSVGNDVIDGTIKSKIQEMKDLMLKKE